MPVRIVTDSACDLPEPICAELGVEVVPLTIRFGDREFIDRKELSIDAFWRELAASPVLPETSAPSVGAFEETFRRLVHAFYQGVAGDPVLRPVYPSKDLGPAEEHLRLLQRQTDL